MRKYILIPLAIVWSIAGIAFVAAAGSEADFKSALAAAESANKEAGALKNQWTTTAQQLAAAKQAAAAGDFDKASSLAKQAEALAKASIAQAKEQQEAWRAVEFAERTSQRENVRMNRREALRVLTAAALAGVVPRIGAAADDDLYDIGRFGNVRVLHLTDTHAQLQPVFFREPSVNIGIGSMLAKPPHLVGRAFLQHFGMEAGGRAAHAFTFLDYEEAAHRYGRMGGFAHLKTLIERLRGEAGDSVLLDGGDLWQGSGLADALQAEDMVDAGNLLGIEAMTGHWEFTYGEKTLRAQSRAVQG